MSLGKILSGGATFIGAGVGAMFGGPSGAAIGAQIGGTVGGMIAGSKAESAERRAARDQRRIAILQAQRQRKELIRDVQFAQAAALASNLGAGLGLNSSMIQGQEASQITTLKDDLGFHAMGGDLADKIWNSTRSAASWRGMQNMSNALGSAANTIMPVIPRGGKTPTTAPTGGVPLISSTGASNWNPSTGTYTSPGRFSNQALGLKGFGD